MKIGHHVLCICTAMVMDFIQRENSGLGIAASAKVIVYWSCGELSLMLYMSTSFWLKRKDLVYSKQPNLPKLAQTSQNLWFCFIRKIQPKDFTKRTLTPAAACKKHPNRVICRRIMNYCRCWDLSLDLTHLTYTTPYYLPGWWLYIVPEQIPDNDDVNSPFWSPDPNSVGSIQSYRVTSCII